MCLQIVCWNLWCCTSFIDFECYSNEHCNSHGSCNNATGKCACNTKWKDSKDCTGKFTDILVYEGFMDMMIISDLANCVLVPVNPPPHPFLGHIWDGF